jgi:hypothetical protein
MLRVGPDTAQYGWVWPNEWPNVEVHTRDKEAADRARDSRDREHVRRGGGAPNRHQTTRAATVTRGALSGEFDRSFPAGSRRRMIAGSLRRPMTWATRGSRSGATSSVLPSQDVRPGTSARARGPTRQRAAHCSRRRPLPPGSSSLDLGSCSSSTSGLSADYESACLARSVWEHSDWHLG